MDYEAQAGRAREVADALSIDSLYGEPEADTLEEFRESAETLTAVQLFDWVDDVDLILAAMPVQARREYYAAHRELVAQAMERAA